jgi:hypothetical protein
MNRQWRRTLGRVWASWVIGLAGLVAFFWILSRWRPVFAVVVAALSVAWLISLIVTLCGVFLALVWMD